MIYDTKPSGVVVAVLPIKRSVRETFSIYWRQREDRKYYTVSPYVWCFANVRFVYRSFRKQIQYLYFLLYICVFLYISRI